MMIVKSGFLFVIIFIKSGSSIDLNPYVQTSLEQSSDGLMLEPVFQCVFNSLIDDSLYDVQWFINNNEILEAESRDVRFSDVNITSLKTHHWSGNYSLNFNVSCSVTAKNITSWNTTMYSMSSNFLAGIIPESLEYFVKEGETVEVSLTSSLPLSCPTSLSEAMKKTYCRMTLNVWTSAQESWETCRNGLAIRDLLLNDDGCSVSLDFNENGNTTSLFNITGYLDGIINHKNRTSSIQFGVSTYPYDSSGIWRNISVPKIKVYVIDSDNLVARMLCTSYNDPHLTTFDGKQWDNHWTGEFIMYKHRYLPYSVNVLFSSCVAGYATCNCGVAIRSRLSLYVVRTCAQVSSKDTKLLTVPYEKLTLNRTTDLNIAKSGRLFEVKLPSGTRVSFELSYDNSWISSVRVQAGVLDIGNSEGMCGLANGHQSDDFIPRQGNVSTDNQTFALSWRIPLKSQESLFTSNSDSLLIIGNYHPERYSLCTRGPDGSSDPNMHNLPIPSMLCIEEESFTANLSVLSDRNVNGDFADPLSYDSEYNETESPRTSGWTNGWTESSARTFCENSFTTEAAVDTCEKKAKVSSSSYVESCIADIKLSGNTTYLQDSLNTFKGACLAEVTHDEAYYVNKTSEGRFLVEVITSFLCPQNCSGHGNCTNASCACFDGYIGSDCSTSTSTPPEVFILPFHGLCDKNSGSCQNIVDIIGFFHSEHVWANLECFMISTNGSIITTTVSVTKLTYHHFNHVSLELPITPQNSQTEAARGCSISLSYDGVVFSNHQTLLIYDKQKYKCDLESLTCEQKTLDTSDPDKGDRFILIAALVACFAIVLVITAILVVKKCKSYFPCASKTSM
ncbi:von Willebrand factor D and EGF domain-containing protein-like, partial [Saccostrea cucullata]|uniref:von Willebrand factor D and EGF domain-containing protein-like n=1 Tax=Saccostrea cuccullata TaxID=36930 RepID=UPI002ED1FE4B